MPLPSDLTPVTERYGAIARAILEADDLDLDPWLYRYCGHSREVAGAERHVRQHTDIFRLGWPREGQPVVVDAGSGFGFSLIVAVLLGARQARGIELNSTMVASVQTYLPRVPAEVRERIDVVQGSVTEMPYPDASADIVLSEEAISHYLDVDGFLAEARRVLRPGGALLISDGNNADNPAIRRKTVEIWEAFERGPGYREIHGHRLEAPYEEVRRGILAERFAHLAPDVRAELARRSAGFSQAQLIEAAEAHERSGAMPASVYEHGQLAVGPDGAAMERLFSPRALVRDLERHGFRARALGYWGGAAGRPLVRAANRVLTTLSPVTMFTAPSFRVVAHKR